MDLYHVLNRGVDKRDIVMDDQDRFRFIHNLFEFNDQATVTNLKFRFHNTGVGHPYYERPRKLLVDIHAFCLMSNHYHLLLSPRVKDGIALFMKKLNGGYTNYFNVRYDRAGALFQGKYKRIHITEERHFLHIPYYIHLNPLDLVAHEWRERKIRDVNKAKDFLAKYRWSSYLDYCGKKNFPSITSREFLESVFKERGGHEKMVFEWLKSFDLIGYDDILLE